MASVLFHFKNHFLKSDFFYDFLHGGTWCVIVACLLWMVRRRCTSGTSEDLLVPGLKRPLFSILGHLYTFPSGKFMMASSLPISAFVTQVVSAHYKLFEKENLFFFALGPKDMLILKKPEAVEELVKSNSLLRKAWAYKFLMPWLGTGLLTSAGSKWRSRRKLLTPSFHFDILKDILPIINEQSRILIHILKEKADNDFVDVVHPVAMCSLDIICASTLGVDVGAQRNSKSQYVQAVLRVSQAVMDRVFHPHLWPDVLYPMFESGRQFRKDLEILHNFTRKVIREKQVAFKQRNEEEVLNENSYTEPKKRRKALMDLLIEHQFKYHDITEEDVREEVDTFTFEGHDTTSMGVSWALYLIGLYPDVQAKLHDEMDSVFGDDRERHVTEDDIREMRYLECVLKESHRLYPSVPAFSRQVEEDLVLCGYKVKKGTMLTVFIYGLHRDPKTFPDPEKFDPDRFLPENCSGRHPFAYIPFSAGPRNCIGQRFALMEEKVVMANILRNFHFKSLDERDKIVVAMDLILRPVGPLRLKFTPRTPASNSF